jgi:short subunit dehydrogenase-like uncharacterized protein
MVGAGAQRRIGLLGATGYTGKLVAAELARRGIPHRLGARNPEKLGALAPSPEAEHFVVDTTDSARLREFCSGVDAVISTVGPFVKYGLPVVEAVTAAGLPYVDSTGEHTFMAEVYDRFADAAAPVVPACGFDYIPGDLAAAIAASRLPGLAREVRLAYGVRGGRPSRGTAMSAIGIVGSISIRPRSFQIHTGPKTYSAVELPWGEQLTVPLHLPMARVVTGVVVPPRASRIVGAMSPLGLAVRPTMALARPLLERLANRLPEGPPEEIRGAAEFVVVAEAIGDGGASAAVTIEGHDPYGITAKFLVEAALRAEGKGAMAPAQALDPVPFLDAVSGDLLRWSAS